MIFWLFEKNLKIVGEIVLACFQVSPFEEGLDVGTANETELPPECTSLIFPVITNYKANLQE